MPKGTYAMQKAEVKFDERDRQERFLSHIRGGGTMTQAAKLAGMSTHSIYRYLSRHPDFKDQMIEAEVQACEPIEEKLRLMALKGDLRAIIFWLCNRSGGRWRSTANPFIINNVAPPKADMEAMRTQLQQFLIDTAEPIGVHINSVDSSSVITNTDAQVVIDALEDTAEDIPESSPAP